MADSPPVRLEVLTHEFDGEARYGVMEVRRHKAGLGYVVHYGPFSQGGNQSDWGTLPDDDHNMRLMALGLLQQLISRADEVTGHG